MAGHISDDDTRMRLPANLTDKEIVIVSPGLIAPLALSGYFQTIRHQVVFGHQVALHFTVEGHGFFHILKLGGSGGSLAKMGHPLMNRTDQRFHRAGLHVKLEDMAFIDGLDGSVQRSEERFSRNAETESLSRMPSSA